MLNLSKHVLKDSHNDHDTTVWPMPYQNSVLLIAKYYMFRQIYTKLHIILQKMVSIGPHFWTNK